MSEIKTVNVLGSRWTIRRSSVKENPYFKQVDGLSDYTTREITFNPNPHEGSPEGSEYGHPGSENKRIIRHELVHAFLFESGLAYDTDWATDETAVDWIARQFPKMLKAFQEAGAL